MSIYLTSEILLAHVQDISSLGSLPSLPLMGLLPSEIWFFVFSYIFPRDIVSLSICCQEMADLALQSTIIEKYYVGIFLPPPTPRSQDACRRKQCESVTSTFCVHDIFQIIRSNTISRCYQMDIVKYHRHISPYNSLCSVQYCGSNYGHTHFRDKKNGLGWVTLGLPILGTVTLVGEYLNDKEKGPWVSLRRNGEIFAIVTLSNSIPCGPWYYSRGGKNHGTGWMTGEFRITPKPSYCERKFFLDEESVRDVSQVEVAEYCARMNIPL